MNSRQKTLIAATILKYDEINRLGSSLLEKDKKEAEDGFFELLVDAYVSGFSGALYLLEEEAETNAQDLYDALYKVYEDGETAFDKFSKYYNEQDADALQRLIDTEWHRNNEAGGYDAAKGFSCKKVWTAILDEKTRETHFILDGTTVDIADKFYSISGDSAFYPGGFNTAEENANCRCKVLFEKY